jgi:arylsulfatase A-like enzyme
MPDKVYFNGCGHFESKERRRARIGSRAERVIRKAGQVVAMSEVLSRRKILKLAGAGMLALGGLYTGGRALERYIETTKGVELDYLPDQNLFSYAASELRGRFGNMPNIVLISLDTLRADCVVPELMPKFCNWATENALRFTDAHAPSTWTLPSHLTMLSGLLPHEHKVETKTAVIPKDIEMVQGEIKKRGYNTAGFTGAGYLTEFFGFSRGFDVWKEEYDAGKDSFSEAEEYVSGYDSGKPLFLFLHTFYIHDYIDPTIHRSERMGYHNAYRECVRNFDGKLMRLIDSILQSSISENLRMIVTSDHGEGFGEAYDLYDQTFVSMHHGDFPCPSQVEIPLVAYDSRDPKSGLSDKLVGLDDVYHTTRLWAGIEEESERYLLA